MLRQLKKWVIAGLVAWGLVMILPRSGAAVKTYYYTDAGGACADLCSPPYPPNCGCSH